MQVLRDTCVALATIPPRGAATRGWARRANGAMRAEKGISLFEKWDSPFREMGQPFSEKRIGLFIGTMV